MAFHLGAPLETKNNPDPPRLAGNGFPKILNLLKKRSQKGVHFSVSRESLEARKAPHLRFQGGVCGCRCHVPHKTICADALLRKPNSFQFPFPVLATCLQFAERKKPEWEQSCQKQSKGRGFRDGCATATTAADALERSGGHRRGAA
jgi:hypothetical protein